MYPEGKTKKIILIFVAFLVAIFLVGCDNQNTTTNTVIYELDEYTVNNYADANMIILDDSVSAKGLMLEFNYYGEDKGSYGSWYTIFVYEDNKWNELTYIVDENIAWTAIACIVERNKANQTSIDWEWLYGELSSGRYLIVKQFINSCAIGDSDVYYLACEFTIE